MQASRGQRFEREPPQERRQWGTRSLRRAHCLLSEDRFPRGLRHRNSVKKRNVIAWVAITSFLHRVPTAVTMMQGDIGFLRSNNVLGIRGACDEPRTLLRGQEPDGLRHSTGLAWRRMLRGLGPRW